MRVIAQTTEKIRKQHIHTHIYIYIYIHTYIHIYIYIYIYIFIIEEFLVIAIESWPEWPLKPGALNSAQTL